MSSVKIVTLHSAVNHGAVIQAYSLARVIRELGFSVEIVDYRPDYVTENYLHAGHILSFTRRTLQYAVFMAFINKRLPLTKTRYRSVEELSRHPPRADSFVCGSDQVWNVKIVRGVDKGYFLRFCPQARKVAYAVSMGKEPVPEELKDEFNGAVSAFDAVSVRESFCVDQLKRCGIGKPVARVLDPTLLMDDFSEIIPRGKTRMPFIAVYSVIRDPEVAACAAKLKRILGMPLVNISAFRMKEADRNEYLLNPGEWLRVLRDSRLVCTNSFHGTALSIALRKDFYSVGMHGSHAGDSRVGELVDSLGLGSRMVSGASELPDERERLLEPADHARAQAILRERRQHSLDFLKKNLI